MLPAPTDAGVPRVARNLTPTPGPMFPLLSLCLLALALTLTLTLALTLTLTLTLSLSPSSSHPRPQGIHRVAQQRLLPRQLADHARARGGARGRDHQGAGGDIHSERGQR